MKEQIILNYIQSIDFTKDDWSLKVIRENLFKLLNETPGISVEWKKDVIILENMEEAKEIERPNLLTVVFTEVDDKLKTIKLLI